MWRPDNIGQGKLTRVYSRAPGRTTIALNRILENRRNAEPSPDMSDILSNIQHKARDNPRTPMQWDGNPPSAGFSSSNDTWMRVNDDYESWNVARQVGNSRSVHSFWKRALYTRKIHSVLVIPLRIPLLMALILTLLI